MALTDNPCLDAILCGLSAPVVAALNSILEAQKTALTAQLTAISAQLVLVNITTLPAQVARGLVNAALDEARAMANIIPIALIAGCTPLGELTTSINTSLNEASAAANDVLNDLNQLLSFRAELIEAQTAIQSLIDNFNQVQVAIAGCP